MKYKLDSPEKYEVAMAVHIRKKSPRAPSFSLGEALDRIMKVYERERLHPAPTELVAQHLGYKSANNGRALSALASLRYFGLLERPKEGALSVSKDVEAFKFAPDEKFKRSLMLKFLRSPALYSELLDKYESGLPSDANLRFELIQRGFMPAAAESALAVFKESIAFADYYSAESSDEIEEQVSIDSPDDVPKSEFDLQPQSEPAFPVIPSASIVRQGEVEDVDSDRIPVRLPGGRRAWLIIPSPFYAADKARLKAQIDLLLTLEDEES